MPFSAAVRDARKRGYTEPDPRDDLSGMDVGAEGADPRRDCSAIGASCRDSAVESLVPKWAADAFPCREFLERLEELDDGWRRRRGATRREAGWSCAMSRR